MGKHTLYVRVRRVLPVVCVMPYDVTVFLARKACMCACVYVYVYMCAFVYVNMCTCVHMYMCIPLPRPFSVLDVCLSLCHCALVCYSVLSILFHTVIYARVQLCASEVGTIARLCIAVGL